MTQRELNIGDELYGCRVIKAEELPEIDGRAYQMEHAVSGAKVLYLQNEDENKSFSIAFPTPPADDTGVFHILEHSVLCGSEKFPVKEPFVDLLKGSMQTFLNAMTFPDKTIYPVASTNEQDLLNLMDVYLDAVLNPMMYRDKRIFEQEGWHYELEGAEDGQLDEEKLNSAHLKYNGVVFNEMKGSLSDPENVLLNEINRNLFPNSCYAFESGGHPRVIPQLTFDSFCDTHARHYRLSNSYIVLYGDLDIDRILEFLDTHYLSKPQPDANGAPNPVGTCEPVRAEDAVVTMDTAPENAHVGLGYVIGDAGDSQRIMAVNVVMDAIMGGNESPLKRALLEANLGGDCAIYMIDSQAKPMALFVLKNAKPGVANQFRDLVENEVRKIVEQGIPRDILEASVAQLTFSLRERDRGVADGVVLAISALSGWLYNDDNATTYLHFEDDVAAMHEGLKSRYFEEVLESLVLQSNHCALVDLQPEAPTEDEEAQELLQVEQALEQEQRKSIVDETYALRVRQESPDTPEDLEKLPKLHISDIGPARPDYAMNVREDTPLVCLHHTVPARQINYLHAFFDLGGVSFEDLPYVSLLGILLGNLDTDKHSAADLDTHIRSHLGDMRFYVEVQVSEHNPCSVRARMLVFASALAEEMEHLVNIPQEIWATTHFDDSERIRNILVQRRISMEEGFVQAGHLAAATRVHSYLFPTGVVKEQLSGVDFYRFLCETIEHFDERFDELVTKLEEVSKQVFVQQRIDCLPLEYGATPLVSFAGTDDELQTFWQLAGDWNLPVSHATLAEAGVADAPKDADPITDETIAGKRLVVPAPIARNEAFIIPSEVNYTARGGDVRAYARFNGHWAVLQRVLSYDYLWNEVRVKGGAYGCGFRGTGQGRMNFHSYRDPQIDATLDRFDAAGKWLSDFQPETDEWEGYIVSTVAGHDKPVKPKQIARRQAAGFLIGQSSDFREKRREEYLTCTPDALRELAPALEAVPRSNAFCTFGNKDAIRAAHASYKDVIDLFDVQTS